jgi:hypothetical protein
VNIMGESLRACMRRGNWLFQLNRSFDGSSYPLRKGQESGLAEAAGDLGSSATRTGVDPLILLRED